MMSFRLFLNRLTPKMNKIRSDMISVPGLTNELVWRRSGDCLARVILQDHEGRGWPKNTHKKSGEKSQKIKWTGGTVGGKRGGI